MFKRLSNLIRGFFGLFISGLERENPEALLEVEKENLRKHIARYNQGLATHAALCEQLMTQVRKLESEETDLRAKTSAHLKAGNRDMAGQLALRLQRNRSSTRWPIRRWLTSLPKKASRWSRAFPPTRAQQAKPTKRWGRRKRRNEVLLSGTSKEDAARTKPFARPVFHN
jgi:hypothetical protein